ncbi:uncharacterized protein LOC113232524 isoform X2 [Hyposmocoma kahamanoa]|uniref:uncharacterized protein LOC113232524 isoform X2 n=1 Tax=Hyposmocoma kahamanoa TaxID=1477025 RepID=UPI000E6D605E|nr:uncharacterized protein LOC113232524 isoform X2 [Hyposmocoma kahamanoa]
MVYLVKAEHSDKKYDNWICGGAIVHRAFILTSAACVEDVTYMYAIAGYVNYIHPRSHYMDECIEKSKKKIVFSCVPKNYNFSYERFEDWARIDIALVKVESPYDFETPISPECSWVPNLINISYDGRDMEEGKDAMALGWGSSGKWRSKKDSNDYNNEHLMYSPVRIQNKSQCMKYYKKIPALLNVIDKYMICTMGSGNIDDEGHEITKVPPTADGCIGEPDQCNNEMHHVIRSSYRKNAQNFNNSSSNVTLSEEPLLATYGYNLPLHEIHNGSIQKPFRRQVEFMPIKRNGICQNDHGGPLVTWVGAKEIVIGTASFYLVRKGLCVGPFLFTSTKENGVFISCILTKYVDDDVADSRGKQNEPVEDLIERAQALISPFN